MWYTLACLNLSCISRSNPANICWPWKHLQYVFSVTILRLPRRLKDVLKRSCKNVLKTSWKRLEDLLQDVFKTSSRRLGRQKIVTLQTSWRCVQDMSWRRLEDMSLKMSWRFYEEKQNTYWGHLYTYLGITNLNVYLTRLHFTNLYLTILTRIQNALIRAQ